MDYLRNGRALVPFGGIFETMDAMVEFAGELESGILNEPLNSLIFVTDEEGYLKVEIREKEYFITYPALRDLCKLVKLPVSFINKFPVSRLTLDTLNQNPYLKDDPHLHKFIIWKWEEKLVISGVLSPDIQHIPLNEFLQTIKDQIPYSGEDLKLDAIVLTGEELIFYQQFKEEITQEGFSFVPGFSLRYSPTRASDTTIHPFYKMSITTKTGEIFDFDFESPKKLQLASRRKADFTDLTLQLATEYVGENLGVDFDNSVKRGMAARQLSSLKFSLLKYFKSRATSVFGYSGMKVTSSAVVEEVIPEYKYFIEANREIIKNKEKYELNAMLVDFFVPVFYNRLFTFHSSSENPYFFVRYRQSIGRMFEKLLEEAGDIILP